MLLWDKLLYAKTRGEVFLRVALDVKAVRIPAMAFVAPDDDAYAFPIDVTIGPQSQQVTEWIIAGIGSLLVQYRACVSCQ